MASCAYCDSFILFGGKVAEGQRYCSAKCLEAGAVFRFASRIPRDVIEKQVRMVHAGTCPRCGGHGPIDVHTSHRVWSAVFMTQWSSHPVVSCGKCGTRAQLRDFGISLIAGWWGFPWGLLMTPVQLTKNVGGLLKKPDPREPTAALHKMVGLNLAAQAMTRTGT